MLMLSLLVQVNLKLRKIVVEGVNVRVCFPPGTLLPGIHLDSTDVF